MSDATIPLLGDLSLPHVQRIEHWLDGGFAPLRVAALGGEVQERVGRPSHRIYLQGVLFGDSANGDLGALQRAATAGEELAFAADITIALELQRVVITSFRAAEVAGSPRRFEFECWLAESPPLPPPASVQGFGGLDDFGLGDLGFDTDIMGDLAGLADDIAGAVDDALGVLDQLQALAGLDGLSLGGVLAPVQAEVARVRGLGGRLGEGARSLSSIFGEGD